MKNLKILIGVPGVGKSTYCKSQRFTHIFESDQYRLDLFGSLQNQDPDSHNIVFNTMHEDLFEVIKNEENYDIIYDATNLNNKKRHILYKLLKHADKNINITSIVFFADLQTLIDRNLNREEYKRVPINVVKQMYKSFKIPFIGYDCDNIEYVGDKWFKKINDFKTIKSIDDLLLYCINDNIKKELQLNYQDHETPYHLESINEHINATIKNAQATSQIDLVKIATFHDLGKGLTKNYVEEKERCQYLNHENISSYYMLNYFYSINELTYDNNELAIRVLYHMLPNDKTITDKAFKRRNINNELKEKLYDFNKIDRMSSIKKEGFH